MYTSPHRHIYTFIYVFTKQLQNNNVKTRRYVHLMLKDSPIGLWPSFFVYFYVVASAVFEHIRLLRALASFPAQLFRLAFDLRMGASCTLANKNFFY